MVDRRYILVLSWILCGILAQGCALIPAKVAVRDDETNAGDNAYISKQVYDQWAPRIDAATRFVDGLSKWMAYIFIGIPFMTYIIPKLIWILFQKFGKKSVCLLLMFLPVVAYGQSLQDLVDAIPARGGTILLEGKNYYADGPLNVRGKHYLRIIGQGESTKLVFRTTEGQPLLADFTDAIHLECADFHVVKSGGVPVAGFVLSRKEDGSGISKVRFTRVIFEFAARIANVVSLGAEVDTWDQCGFLNSHPGSWNFITGRENWVGVTSPFGPITGGSNVCHVYLNCHWGNYAFTGNEGNIWLMDGTGYTEFIGGTVSNKFRDQPTADWHSRAVMIGGRVNRYGCFQIVFNGLEMETYGVDNCIEIVGDVRGLRATNNLFCSLESGVRVFPGALLRDSVFSQNTWSSGRALYDWGDGPKRALFSVSGGTLADTVLDLRFPTLAKLKRDYPISDQRRRPEIAFVAYDKAVISALDLIIQKQSDVEFDNSVFKSDVEITATKGD